ncbi:hypothetical protein TNIN_405291 [Trichonephila inaurata madagascariensis]|uniref:Uncharacterized protein n=1 Tax=Trichonephila inaurata madagascariensis TaxID=2747483 RepID=A0A8X7C2Q1_9ARAC|nr:hypothetical protein TNIN_405291 [Trichonephila inaurata madagascariensis]
MCGGDVFHEPILGEVIWRERSTQMSFSSAACSLDSPPSAVVSTIECNELVRDEKEGSQRYLGLTTTFGNESPTHGANIEERERAQILPSLFKRTG